MQADVFPLIVFDLDRDLGLRLAFGSLDPGLDRVVLPADRNSLRKLAPLIGYQFPLGFLPGDTLDFDGDSGNWAVVRPPNGADDQGVVFVGGVGLCAGLSRMERRHAKSVAGCKNQQQDRANNIPDGDATMSHPWPHATPLPLLRPLP